MLVRICPADHWEGLNLASCPELDTLKVHIHFRGDSEAYQDVPQPQENRDVSREDEGGSQQEDEEHQEEEDVPQPRQDEDALRPSLAAIGMLSQVSRTVRDVTIQLHGLPSAPGATPELLKKGRLLGLQAFDEAITREAFPLVKKVHLRMRFQPAYRSIHDDDWGEIQDVVWSKTLPNLDGQGLLNFGFKVEDYYRVFKYM